MKALARRLAKLEDVVGTGITPIFLEVATRRPINENDQPATQPPIAGWRITDDVVVIRMPGEDDERLRGRAVEAMRACGHWIAINVIPVLPPV